MMSSFQKQRAEEFKKMRQTLGLTQAQLGERLNITGLTSAHQIANLVSCWETKKKPIPDDCFSSLQRIFNDNILASASKPEQVMPHSVFTCDGLMLRTFPTYELAEQHASVIVKETGRTVEIGSLVVTHIVQPQVTVKIVPVSQSRADAKEHKSDDNDSDLILNNDETNDDSNHLNLMLPD